MRPWKVLREDSVYQAKPWLEVWRQTLRLDDGKIIDDYHRIYFPDYIAVFSETADGRVILLRQYRNGIGSVDLAFPGGSIEPGEQAKDAARRELLEETGYTSDEWQFLGQYSVHSNYGCGKAHFFYAKNAKKKLEPEANDLEATEIVFLTREELRNAITSGKMKALDSAALAGLMKLG